MSVQSQPTASPRSARGRAPPRHPDVPVDGGGDEIGEGRGVDATAGDVGEVAGSRGVVALRDRGLEAPSRPARGRPSPGGPLERRPAESRRRRGRRTAARRESARARGRSRRRRGSAPRAPPGRARGEGARRDMRGFCHGGARGYASRCSHGDAPRLRRRGGGLRARGGRPVARQLVRRGRRVLLLERGVDERRRFYYGTYLGALLYTDRASLLFTEEGLNVVRPLMLGGATSMYCGCAAPPPDVDQGALRRRPGRRDGRGRTGAAYSPRCRPRCAARPPTRPGPGGGRGPGFPFFPQPKFMSPARAPRFPAACGARCMLGCRSGAKWNAAEWVDEAVGGGAR